ncbi:cellulose binding domain-containing protein [Actinomadura sp. BRA 177]|uniref:cellulose binding domain-containing protein n=1 Tax=Actinomadura sp. BRA 177 TaxID=2745202 RepID=UPI001596338B|nr:cellulose binding domain-containing protein [Actinomadura sp. BRA 177]NVI88997.1 cellulose binding domain-containing protein [Actinomadura sp. BRA 177]
MRRTLLPGFLFTALCSLVLALLAPVAANAASLTATFTKSSDWGSGYEGKYTIKNETGSAISSWKVEFDLPSGSSVGTYWDALLTKSGQHSTFTNREYNGAVAAGASVSFGFIVGGSGAPQGCKLNGASCDGGGGPTEPGTPSAPGTPTVTGKTDTSLTLSWSPSSGDVSGYRVYEGSTARATVNGTSTTISGLTKCSNHTYTVKAYNSVGESAASASVSATTTGCTTPPVSRHAAPYLYLGWGNPPDPTTVMNATGIKWFTMAFILSGGGCTPSWDSQRPLKSGVDEQAIAKIRAAGGDVLPSIGGWSGNKLGPNCSTPQALAGAYQQVIDAYGLKAIDVDIENSDEFENAAVQDRILGALKIIEQNNPGIQTILTMPTLTTGPNYWGTRLIDRAAELQVPVDIFSIMPFNFGGGADMYGSTVQASEGLKTALTSAFGWSDAVAYTHMGISGMNGRSDQGEITTTAVWTQIRDWAKSHGLARFTFWSVNRDRPGSGTDQTDWQFTKITAGF